MSLRGLLGSVEEPATTATDWVMAALASAWAFQLLSSGVERGAAGVPTRIWGVAFTATALSALVGGVVHGWQRRMGHCLAQPLWRGTLHLLTVAGAAVTVAALLVLPPGPIRTVVLVIAGVKLVVANLLLLRDPSFRIALTDYATALGMVVVMQAWAWWRHQAPSTPWIAAGVALSALAGCVQALEVSPHDRFNHNDLYHVLQIGALWLLYRGGLLLGPA